jgi:protein-L-isoaspartate(D-aspartate) O-methyltransferase
MARTETEYASRRKHLVESLVRDGCLSKKQVIDAMLRVPRHIFVPPAIVDDAYGDYPMGIGEGQTISAPHMVAIMCEHLDLVPGNRVLEVGSGSGYHAAVVAEIIGERGHVFTVERVALLAEFARQNIEKCRLSGRVDVVTGDGSMGLPEKAPFDRIYVTAASPAVPPPLVEQLGECGILEVPVGGRFYQELIVVRKRLGKLSEENFGGCVFVPLIGEHGQMMQ